MCVCVCLCVCVCTHACAGSKVKEVQLSIVVCLLIQLGFHCAAGSVYILSTLLFLYGALRAHVRCKRLINTLLHYICNENSI